MRSHRVFTNSLFLSSAFIFAMKSSWFMSLSGSFFKQCLWYLFHARSSQMCTSLSTRYFTLESPFRNRISSLSIHLKNTFFVVNKGNHLLKSNLIWRPKTERMKGGSSQFFSYSASTSGVKNTFLSDPFFMISFKRSRYWYSGCFMAMQQKI